MKTLRRDLKHCSVKIQTENLDDLWYLSRILEPGDRVRGRTVRRIKDRDDSLRSQGGERMSITVSVELEKIEFQDESGVLRLSGVIVGGPEDLVSIGSHSTLAVDANTRLSITKEKWSAAELELLKDAEKSALRPKLIIAVVDDGGAVVVLVRESRIQYSELSGGVGGKYDTGQRAQRKQAFYGRLLDAVRELREREENTFIVIAGAGFEKESFHAYLREHDPELAAEAVVEHIGGHGRNGVQEVLKRSKTRKIIEEVNIARDLRLLEEVLAEIGRDSGLAVYGPRDIEVAASAGAVEFMLVSDSFFLKNRGALEPVMEAVHSTRGRVHIVDGSSEAGRQLDGLGGVAGLLRFRLQ